MEKRDMETPTKFAQQIKEECHIYDLQGLCKDSRGNYTIAIEALDMGNDPVEAYIEVFSDDEIFAKSCFAKRINAEFVLMLHKKEQSGDEIYMKFFEPDQASKKAVCVNEKNFLILIF